VTVVWRAQGKYRVARAFGAGPHWLRRGQPYLLLVQRRQHTPKQMEINAERRRGHPCILLALALLLVTTKKENSLKRCFFWLVWLVLFQKLVDIITRIG